MRNYFNEINKLADGIYVITDKEVQEYTGKWAYGYIINVRPLEFSDLKDWTMFRLVHNGDVSEMTIGGETHEYPTLEMWLVKHVDALQDAKKLAADLDQTTMYSLRDEKEISID